MGNEKKRIIVPLIFLIIGLVIIFMDKHSGGKKTDVQNNISSLSQQQTNQESKVVSVNPTKAAVAIQDNLDTTPSPFAPMPTASAAAKSIGNVEAHATVSGAPPLLNIPPANKVPFSASTPVAPGASAFTRVNNIPSVPAMRKIIVKAILFKDGESNMAVLGDGQGELIVYEGQNSDWGYISQITNTSVTLAGKVLSLSQ